MPEVLSDETLRWSGVRREGLERRRRPVYGYAVVVEDLADGFAIVVLCEDIFDGRDVRWHEKGVGPVDT